MSALNVSEFVIVPPAGELRSILSAKDQVIDYLCRKFPGYGFQIAPMAPVDSGGGDYIVIPIMCFIGDDGKGQMCDPPPRWLLSAIAAAMAGFKLKQPALH